MGLLNTGSSSDKEVEQTTVEQELQRSKKTGRRDVIICFVIIILFLLFKNSLGLGQISPILGDEEFGIIGIDGETRSFRYDSIASIELREDISSFKHGELVNGTENKRCWSGVFHNSEFGEYELHVDPRNSKYIVVQNPDGVIVFNIEAPETTQSLYDFILDEMNN